MNLWARCIILEAVMVSPSVNGLVYKHEHVPELTVSKAASK